MATETIKILGQVNPASTTLTPLYTVPASTVTVVSTLVVANRTSSTRTVRVSVAPGGAADSVEQYLLYDTPLVKNDSNFYTLGISLATTDVMRVYVDSVGVSFNLFGVEVS